MPINTGYSGPFSTTSRGNGYTVINSGTGSFGTKYGSGGGFYGDGEGTNNYYGKSFINGGAAGGTGGFGGGGGGGYCGGGGGGYTGGAWGDGNSSPYHGLGGGSYWTGTGSKAIAGNQSMPNPRGTGNITGNNGNGYARITYLGTSI